MPCVLRNARAVSATAPADERRGLNDVNAAALGEYDHGAGKGNDSMLMMTIGTGTGGTVVTQGDVYHGYSRSAGETGYMWVDGYHFQDIAGTTALVANS